MVLSKRKRDGEFTVWASASQNPSTMNTPGDLPQPQLKKARTKPAGDNYHTARKPAESQYKTALASASSFPASVPPDRYNPPKPTPTYVTSTSYALPQAFSQSGPSQASQVSKPSRSRKKADPNAPKPEKRGAIFKKSCPKNILERVERVMSQRFFMIDRQRTAGELKEVFGVLGSTGNVYSVTIDHKPSCTCMTLIGFSEIRYLTPDRSGRCERKPLQTHRSSFSSLCHRRLSSHQTKLFIFLKVLQVTQASGVWYQKALLTSELETVFAEAPLAPNAVANHRIREAYARATGKSTGATQSTTKKRIPGPDDDCPICYEGMHSVNEKSLIFCEDCGNALHKECFQQWQASSARGGTELTCVWCRAKWVFVGAGSSSAGASRSEGYLNLATVSGTSPVRDTSTYYNGPRRGQRYYGYQDYLD
ncbi:hypothetical protein Hypma_009779 [Hypsizygus marmoreus]|uniref:RING-type domain-containing protein n=1 Tax=Hypsizygus marmoreus TaxID=39966 RepID=A0A369JU69_HYPMA|nr:hypothetical protein Hypma_009779 [Hypsizygus marmoreus]